MSWKDRIALVLSIFAVSISATGSYFTFFRITPAVEAAVLGAGIDRGKITARVAVMNTGNRQIALLGAELFLIQNDGGELLRQTMSSSKLHSESDDLHVLLEPGKLVLLTVEAPLDMDAVIAYRQQVEYGEDHSHKTVAGVNLWAFSATGEFMYTNLDSITIQLRDRDYGGHAIDATVMPLKKRKS
jgi:hypothetical protein